MFITFWLFVNISYVLNIETIYCIKHVHTSKVTDCGQNCFMDMVENMLTFMHGM